MLKVINNMRGQGFALIQLLVVIEIISILAVIAVSGFLGIQNSARKGVVL
jgi:Tfp pilus assembly protein FimT